MLPVAPRAGALVETGPVFDGRGPPFPTLRGKSCRFWPPVLSWSEIAPRARGRPWIAPRRIVDGVLFVLRTGCQWKAVPREFGSGSTVHRRLQRWTDEGRWEAMWRQLLQYAEATQQL